MEETGGSMVVRRPPPLLHLHLSSLFLFPSFSYFLVVFFLGLPGFDSWWVMVKMVLERKMIGLGHKEDDGIVG